MHPAVRIAFLLAGLASIWIGVAILIAAVQAALNGRPDTIAAALRLAGVGA